MKNAPHKFKIIPFHYSTSIIDRSSTIFTRKPIMKQAAMRSELHDAILQTFGSKDEFKKNMWIITTINYEFWLNANKFSGVLIPRVDGRGLDLYNFCMKKNVNVCWLNKECLEVFFGTECNDILGIAISKQKNRLVASTLQATLPWVLEVAVGPAANTRQSKRNESRSRGGSNRASAL
jgi:hypothetical protein